MATRLPIKLGGGGGFCGFRRRGMYTVDKTLFIQHVIEAPYISLLIPRPRRFGKTFNMTTLKDFLERPASAELAEQRRCCFEGSKIWAVASAREHFQQYPVLHFSFRACKGAHWEEAWVHIRRELVTMLDVHRVVLETPGVLTPLEASWYTAGLAGSLPSGDYAPLLARLSAGLFRVYGVQVVILIDEYDTPIHDALEHGYYPEAIGFFKSFLTLGFKDNDHLFKGVITGILRVSKENMFSELNNVGVYSLLNDMFATDFGLTQEEVIQILEDQGCIELLPDIEKMYNGYLFGYQQRVAIYNPWSTLSCIADEYHSLRPYWNKSGSPELLHTLVVKNGPLIHQEIQRFLEQELLTVTVTEHINLTALERSPTDLFSFMLFTGYLKAAQVESDGEDWQVQLALVNQELHAILTKLYRSWLLRGQLSSGAEPLMHAVLGGDAAPLEEQLKCILLNNASFLDGATRKPENFYQGLMLGLLVLLKKDYEVISNLESGRGRADLLLLPRTPGRVGVVMELKVVKQGSSHAASLLAGLAQLQLMGYTTRLEARQASPIHAYAVAFDGKDVRVALESDRPALEQERAELQQQRDAQGRAALVRREVQLAQASTPSTGSRRLPARDRLALETLIVPRLTPPRMQRLWSLCGYRPPTLSDDTLLEAWDALLLRSSEEDLLSELALVLVFMYPELKDDPTLVKLQAEPGPRA